MTQRVMGFEPALAPARTVTGSAVDALPAQDELGLSRGVPRWICLVVADAVAVAASTVAVLTYWDATSRLAVVVAVMVVAFLAALAASGSYGRNAEGLIVSRRLGRPGVLSGLPLGVVLASLAGRATVPDRAGGLGLEQAALVAVLGLAAIPAARVLVPALVTPQRRGRRGFIPRSGRAAA